MFDGIIQGYVDKYKPHFLSGYDEWRTWCDRVLIGLEAVRMQIAQEQFETDDARKFPNLTVAVAAGQELDIVPANETWLLEAVSFVGAAPSVLALRSGGRLLWSRSMALADNQPGNNVVFTGGSIITIDASAVGEVTAQFRRRQPRESVRHNVGGTMPTVGDPAAGPMDQETILRRHRPAYPISNALVR